MSRYAVIVDTDRYSGNFERQMCAYMTGQVGECEVGKQIADEARKEIKKADLGWLDDHVMQEPDEHGCCRPVAIEPTPGILNDGMGGHYDEQDDPQKVKDRYVKATENYFNPLIKKAEDRIKAGETAWTRDLKGYVDHIKEAEKNGPGQFPAYQSIIIFFDIEPPQHIRNLLTERAKYAGKNAKMCLDKWQPNEIKITDVRFVKKTIKTEVI